MAIKYQKLTRAGQRQLSAGQKLEEHGISFERLINGDGRYTINMMVDGQRIHRVVGKESEGVTRLQVEELIAKLRTDARQRILLFTFFIYLICTPSIAVELMTPSCIIFFLNFGLAK